MPANIAAPKKTGATVLSLALEIRGGEMPPEGARFVLGRGIREEGRERMLELLAKQRRGEITPGEREDLESYIQADNVHLVLKAQALLTLKRVGEEGGQRARRF